MSRAFDPNKEELYHVAGDADTGIAADTHLTKSAWKQPQIRYSGKYGDFVMTCEIYKIGNELSMHLICPKCRHALMIKNTQKQMDWDDDKGLTVEPFRCTWELDDRRIEFGVGLCNWTAVIDCSRVRDA